MPDEPKTPQETPTAGSACSAGLGRERRLFEQWYVTHAFDYGKNPLGSRDCGLQWEAWKAAVNAHTPKYHDVEQYLDGQA